MHHCNDLIQIFNRCFSSTHNTQLMKGGDEPIYLPADSTRPYHAIFFAHGFFSSALHECAHWLLAGEERRKQIDFGYWYAPDGRTAEQQTLFQHVEVKPQAMEWILSNATGHRFYISTDNLSGEPTDNAQFKYNVHQQALNWCTQGLPERATLFRNALCQFYRTPFALKSEYFSKDQL